VIVWNRKKGKGYGHVSVFIHGDVNGFTSFDQNWTTVSKCTESEHDYVNVLGCTAQEPEGSNRCMTRRLLLPLLWLYFAVSPVFGQAAQRVEFLPDGSVLLSPQALSGIDTNLRLLESNLVRQQQLLTSLSGELSVAESSLTTLKGLYNEQSVLVTSLRLWAEQLGERLSVSEQSLVWVMEDAQILETELAREQTNSARLDQSVRVWRTVAIVAGVIALVVDVAAVVW
jgi:hypothetical protein